MKNSAPALRLSTHYRNRRIAERELRLDDAAELVVGRDEGCGLRLPNEDRHASRRHARIFHDGKAWQIESKSSNNPLFADGKVVASARLKPGLCLRLGQTFLRVDRGEAERVSTRQASRLVRPRKGLQPGHQFVLEGEKVSLGRHPDKAQILLKSSKVSGVHAQLLADEKGNWVLNIPGPNPNPSRVNGELQAHDSRDRLLHHNDLVELADERLIFKDGRVQEIRSTAIRTLCVTAAVLLGLVGVYKGYRAFTPSAKVYLAQALESARQEQFGPALTRLDDAHHAKDARGHSDAIEARRQQIESWKKTEADYRHFSRLMHAGDWEHAAPFAAGLLNTRSISSWQWNGQAEARRREVEIAKQRLDALLNIRGALQREDESLERIQDALDAAAQAPAFPAPPPAFANRLQRDLDGAGVQLNALFANIRALNDALAGLESATAEVPAYPDIVGISERVTTLVPKVRPGQRLRFRSFSEPLQGLAASYQVLTGMGDQVRSLQFNEALEMELTLPAEKHCAVDPRISLLRVFLLRNHQGLRERIGIISEVIRQVKRHQVGGQAALASLQDPARLEQLFACDSLQHPLPRRSATSPSGTFDAILGIREFHAFLKSLADPQLGGLDQAPFPTALREAGRYLAAVERFNTLYETNPWLQGDAMKLLYRDTREAVQARDAIVTAMLQRAADGPQRDGVIAGGIALRLGGPREFQNEALDRWLHRTFRKNEAAVRALYDTWRQADRFEAQLRLMNEILDTGLPGNGFVKEMWGKRMAEERTATTLNPSSPSQGS